MQYTVMHKLYKCISELVAQYKQYDIFLLQVYTLYMYLYTAFL